jgi:phospho-N-acetylmuramoyl-pentapeptide-transferase
MLYHLFTYLNEHWKIPGAALFQYLSFRASMAVLLSIILMIFNGQRFIDYLRRKQIGETVRDLGLEGQIEKKGTPTMGGILILGSIVIPTLDLVGGDRVYR